ncbi:MAG: NDP-hexose 4-ketoreductase, partial [Chloroflexales bacterium]|nr:NDP-hexose 4-ketoreductase [Chloroflexales bacterium]
MSDRLFDKFTKRARQVLQFATEEARNFNHPYVGTEHILLGLIREGESISARVLDELGIKLPQARSAVEFIVGPGEGPARVDQDLTARAKKVIEYAIEEAKRLNHHYIGSEHLLLGLVRNGEGVATGVLDIMGVSLEQVRNQVLRVMRHGIGGAERSGSAAQGG